MKTNMKVKCTWLTEKCKHEEHVDLGNDDVLEHVVELPVTQLVAENSQDLFISTPLAFQAVFILFVLLLLLFLTANSFFYFQPLLVA